MKTSQTRSVPFYEAGYSADRPILPGLRETYPTFSDDKLREVQDRMERYLRLVIRFRDRISADPIENQKYKRLRAMRLAWEKTDQSCRCHECWTKFEQAFDSAQTGLPSFATAPNTDPEAKLCRLKPVEKG